MFISVSVSVLLLVLMEGLLSFDNALVLAAMVKHLPETQRRRALTYGIFGAFCFRILALVGLGFILKYPMIKILGGMYLLYLVTDHFFIKHSEKELKPNQFNFWRTVIAIELADIAFSLDSVLAAYGVNSNTAIVVVGGVIGIIMMRFAALIFVRLIELYPRLEDTAYLLISIIASRLIFDAIFPTMNEDLVQGVVWSLMFLSMGYGISKKKKLNLVR